MPERCFITGGNGYVGGVLIGGALADGCNTSHQIRSYSEIDCEKTGLGQNFTKYTFHPQAYTLSRPEEINAKLRK